MAACTDDALALVGLAELTDVEAALVSGGERQETHFAQILARNLDLYYQVLLLDEIKSRGKGVATGTPEAVLTRDNLRDVFRDNGVLRDGVLHIESALRSWDDGASIPPRQQTLCR